MFLMEVPPNLPDALRAPGFICIPRVIPLCFRKSTPESPSALRALEGEDVEDEPKWTFRGGDRVAK